MNDHLGPTQPIKLDIHSPQDDYLWDRSGAADPAVRRLENLLAPARYRDPLHAPLDKSSTPIRLGAAPWRAAAILALTIGVVWTASISLPSNRDLLVSQSSIAWPVQALAGSPRIVAAYATSDDSLRIGQWLVTDEHSQARIEVVEIGHVTVDPDSRVRLLESRPREHRLQLAKGRIEAFITAPPRLFFVDMPSATAIDLGCAYNLEADEHGDGKLQVTLGWVALQGDRDKPESIVPRGGMCLTRHDRGPGTPLFADAPLELQKALERFDFERGGEHDIQTILDHARAADTLTLWHLLPRVEPNLRKRVFDVMAALTPPPPEVTCDGVMRLDEVMLKRWQQSMDWSW